MAKEPGKVTVKVNEDFFDRANQIQRLKGQEVVLRSDYAKTLGKSVSVKKGSTGPQDMSMDNIKSEPEETEKKKVEVRAEKKSNAGPNPTKKASKAAKKK